MKKNVKKKFKIYLELSKKILFYTNISLNENKNRIVFLLSHHQLKLYIKE